VQFGYCTRAGAYRVGRTCDGHTTCLKWLTEQYNYGHVKSENVVRMLINLQRRPQKCCWAWSDGTAKDGLLSNYERLLNNLTNNLYGEGTRHFEAFFTARCRESLSL